MKKLLFIMLPIILVGGIVMYILLVSKPINDNKRLYISCNNKSDSFKLSSGEEFVFSEKNNDCKLNFNISNVEREFLKLKFEGYLYPLDGNGDINEKDISQNFSILPNETLILYSLDKETQFKLDYK